MLIRLRVEGWPPRRWHSALAKRLARELNSSVEFEVGASSATVIGRDVQRVLGFERLTERADQAFLDPVPATPSPPQDAGDAEIVVDLSAAEDRTAGSWRPLFDGRPGWLSAAHALSCGRFPLVTIQDPDGVVRAEGRPGSEQPGVLSVALADVLTGTGTILAAALSQRSVSRPVPDPGQVGEAITKRAARLLAERTARKALHSVYRLATRSPHWRVGWRKAAEGQQEALLAGRLGHEWSSLPDDGYHFYADPFLFDHHGQEYLFVEDFDHRVGRAHISVVEMDEGGPRGVPRAVLRHEVHLSYPFVLEHRGQVWMIPETSGAGRIEIYRATRFPDTWEREAVLVDDVIASDATPLYHQGRWWLFATVRNGGSYSDHLHLWTAPDLLGPWTPHPGNPVLVDIASARPAGRFLAQDGKLLRPTQDGRGGYGAALNLMEVTRLDDRGFEQRLVSQILPGEHWPGRRIHTFNTSARFAVVDGSRIAPRAAFLRPVLNRLGRE